MRTIYKSIIGFLYRNYCGTRQVKIFGKMYTATKASRIFYPFMVVWGLTHTFQVESHLHWGDAIFIPLAIVQYIAGFTNVAVNEYNRLNTK